MPPWTEVCGVKWTKPEFSPDEIRQAGVILRDAVGYQGKEIPVGAQYDAPKAILNNWKASHHRPLNHLYTNLYNHTKRAIKGSDPLVSQRVKRIESILFKLRDKPAQIDLLNMQDLGGCRAIVGTLAQLRTLEDLQRLSQVAHQLL